MRQAARFDETQPFAPWLKRIAINAAVDSLRRSRRLEIVHDEESTFHTWALGESAEDDLRRWAVADAVAGDVRQALRAGPTIERRIEGSRRALMPVVALLAVFPLGFMLFRRNA